LQGENEFTPKSTKMKNILQKLVFSVIIAAPGVIRAQAPNLGSASEFVLFSSDGALTNTGMSHLTGDVGTNNGSSTTFGNVNGVMNDNNGASALAATDLLVAYNQLNAAIPTFFPAPLLGNGQSLVPGIYSISGNATLTNTLVLDGQGNLNAVFIIQIQGAFSAAAGSQVILTGNAKACNVFWKVEGLVSMASGSTLRGTIIANNSAISISSGATLEGRALTTTGAITISNILAFTPIGCGSPVLTGPGSPALGTSACYVLFSSNGAVTNAGITNATGDIGTNVGLTTGYNALNVTGSIHPIPDVSTGNCTADLLNAYNYLNLLPYDIELLSPAQFGFNLVLTPHVYRMNAATALTDTIFLNGAGNANAVFVIQINGALSTSTYAKISLTNGTQSKNVFWCINGSVSINDYSQFVGTIICNNGAVNLNTGVVLDGRALTTDGAFSTNAITATMPAGCSGLPTAIIQSAEKAGNTVVSIYPNPFSGSVTFLLEEMQSIRNYELSVYNAQGVEVAHKNISSGQTSLDTRGLSSGLYFYMLSDNQSVLANGKLISQQ
jgi:hypothetical protein